MAFLQFNRLELINLEYSLSKEILRASPNGTYLCTTIIGCNTRKYHGLLVCPIPGIGSDKYVLLSSLDETIIQHNTPFNLGIHKYGGGHFSPKGHKYLIHFEADSVPTFIYKVGNTELRKELIFDTDHDRIIIKYTLLDASSPITLQLRPFLGFRNFHDLTHANMEASHHFRVVGNGVAFRLYEQFPELCMQFNTNVEFIPFPEWYYNIEYPEEQKRGYAYKEDLNVPGYFEVTLKKGETVIVGAGTAECVSQKFKKDVKVELQKHIPCDSFDKCLKFTASQFFVENEYGTTIVAGYPWFKALARDSFIALPGLKLALENNKEIKQVEKKLFSDLTTYLKKRIIPKGIEEFSYPDIPLWAAWSILRILENNPTFTKKYHSTLSFIAQSILNKKVPNLEIHPNGLLWCDGIKKPITWMNSTINNMPSIARSGYIVELNAIWYNLMKFIHIEQSNTTLAKKVGEIIPNFENSFQKIFWNKKEKYLCDYNNGLISCCDLRPNMLFAISQSYSPLSHEQQKSVLDAITTNLLASLGIRTLSPNNPSYVGELKGNPDFRNENYHQGTIWPWLLGSYCDAVLRILKMNGSKKMHDLISNFEAEMRNNGLGGISEFYDGNPPYKAGGAIFYTINTAELYRMYHAISSLKTEA